MTTTVASLPAAFAAAPDLDAVNALLPQAGLGPGWAKPKPSVYPQPHKVSVPAHWRAAETRAALDSAARYVDTHMSERRNLILVNPHEGNDYTTARTLVAAYQLVLAGETARSHRHSPNALRLVLDAAPGACTIVDGVRVPMEPGDVLLTPNWAWHGHDNGADADAFWIDFLDVPFIHLIEPLFFEQYSEWIERAGEPDAASPYRFAFSQTGPAVRAAAESRPRERWLELGPPHMTTIGLALRHLSAGAALHDSRTTMNAVYAVLEGTSELAAEGKTFTFSRGDVLVVPAWTPADWTASADTILLRVVHAVEPARTDGGQLWWGRIWLCGDSAHQLLPAGGFGMTTGIQEAADLAWKLAAVIQGWGGPTLLPSYEAERQPVAKRNVTEAAVNLGWMLSTRKQLPPAEMFEPGPAGDAARKAYGDMYTETMKPEWFTLGVTMGYRYDNSPIIVPDGTPAPPLEVTTYTQTARPGARALHVWLGDDRSTIDLFDLDFVLLRIGRNPGDTLPDGTTLEVAAKAAGLPLRTVDLVNADVAEAYERRLVLVRPDGHVAWRADDAPDQAEAARIVDVVRGAVPA